MKNNELNKNFLLIAGGKASGKGLIRGVLDGHQQLFVSPYHELIFDSFYSRESNTKKTYDIESARNALAYKGRYYQLERLSHEQKLNVPIAAGMVDKGIDIDFDFYQFDKYWAQNLISKSDLFTPNEICLEIYNSFHKHLKSSYLLNSSSINYFCSMSGDDYDSIPLFLKTYNNAKIIYTKRDPIESISSILGRQPSPFNKRFKKFSRDKLINIYCSYEFISSIVRFDIEAQKVIKEYPSKILNIDFHTFFENRINETTKISNFLNIENNSILNNYSSVGCVMLKPDGGSLLKSPVDKGYENLTTSEIKQIQIHIENAFSEFAK